jgi:hypothetical protein
MAESDWFASERHIKIINIILAADFTICLAGYSSAAPEVKFNKVRLLLIIVFRAPLHMLPPLFHNDANNFC